MQHNPLPSTMRAMVFEGAGRRLLLKQLPLPIAGPGQVLIKVIACGVCRTDLHIVDGDLTKPKLPLIPGHEIVGRIVTGSGSLQPGDLVGVPWPGYTCGHCRYCRKGKENLCENGLFTGYTMDGGYAEYTVANEAYCLPLPEMYGNPSGAPLLCAGLIGYRAYSMTGAGSTGSNAPERLGLYGFGAAAHILIQIAVHQGLKVYAFTRDGDTQTQDFARELGAAWAGDSSAAPPEPMDAAIIFAPVGELVPKALQHTDKGGCVICGGIHMSDIPGFPYVLLWEERLLRSVANLTRKDGCEFLALAPMVPVRTETNVFPLEEANEALEALRSGKFQGAAALLM